MIYTHRQSRGLAPSVLVVVMAAGCAGTDAKERESALESDAGAGGSLASPEAGTGGAAGTPVRVDSGGADAPASCVPPPAIDPATWPACAGADGGATSAVPEGVVLADWDASPWEGSAHVVGDAVYLTQDACRCPSLPFLTSCSGNVPYPCTWNIVAVEPCSRSLVPVASGLAHSWFTEGHVYASVFAPVPDGVFWVNHVQVGIPAEGRIQRSRTGEDGYVTARVAVASAVPLLASYLAHLSYVAGRLYWVEAEYTCPSASSGCYFARRRLVSADATRTDLPDEALTILLDGEGRDATSDLFDVQAPFSLTADDTHVYVLAATGLHRVPVLGGTWETVTDCPGGASRVVLAGDHAYAAVPLAGHPADAGPAPLALTRVPKGGGACEVVATDVSGAIAAHEGSVYFGQASGGSCTSILGLRPGGTEPEVIASVQGFVSLRSVESGRLVADVPGALVGLTLPW